MPALTRALTVVGAMVATLVIWLVAVGLTGADLIVHSGPTDQRVGVAAVLVVTALAGLVAWALLAILERRTARARTIWTVITAVVLVLSLAGPIGSAANPAATGWLAAMHLATGAVLIPLLGRTARRRPAA